MLSLDQSLRKYTPYDKKESEDVETIISFLENNQNCYSRTNLKGHITAGAFVCDNEGNILLNHHGITDMWFQFGGHCDGEEDVLNVAKREVEEESGIKDFTLGETQIFDVAVNEVAFNERKNEPEHFHYDINFLFVVNNHDFKISEESFDIKWVSINEALKLVDPNDYAMLRMIKKYEEYLTNN